MDPVKEAFDKVKQDIRFLKDELGNLRKGVLETRERMIEVCEIIKKMDEKIEFVASTHKPKIQTQQTPSSTHNLSLEALKPQNLLISTGNEGASTDRQTDTSTDTSTHFLPNINKKKDKTIESDIQEATNILDSLDALKKQIRLKFKHVTQQEMLVFSTIYQLEEQAPNTVSYKEIALKLGLSESSIRDYVQRMINKGIPIKKHKINNKKLILSISPDLKRIATLNTIIKLREL